MEEPHVCEVCADFEPQAWRKSLCRNCFHSLDEHSEEMLAAEAEAAAKEKTEKTCPKVKDIKKPDDSSKDTKTKGKIAPPPLSKSQAVGVKGKGQPTTPSSYTSTSSSSSSSSSSHISKPSLKSSTSVTSKTSPSQTTSASSSSTSTTSTSSSNSKTNKNGQSTPTPTTGTSKAKSLTSKFENKTTEAKDSKPATKVPSKLGSKTKITDSVDSSKTEEKESKTSSSTSKITPPSKLGSGNDVKKVGESKKSETQEKSDSSTSGKGDKDVKIPASRSKFAAPFGKDMLKSTKEAVKKDVKGSEQSAVSKSDTSIKTDSGKSTPVSDETKKSAKLDKSESTEKTKASIPEKTPDKSAVKIGQKKTQPTEGTGTGSDKLPDNHGASQTTREIDKSGTDKIKGEAGQNASKDSGLEKGAGLRQPSSNASGKDVKDDKRKQGLEKIGGISGEREGKGSLASDKWQVGAKSESPSGSGGAVELSAKKGPSDNDIDAGSRSEASRKDSVGAGGKKDDGKSTAPLSKVTSPSTSSSLSASSGPTTAAKTVSSTKPSTVVTSSENKGVTSTSSSANSKLSSPTSKSTVLGLANGEKNGEKEAAIPAPASSPGQTDDKTAKRLSEELKKKDEKVVALESKLSKMEERLKTLEEENKQASAKDVSKGQKDEMEKLLQSLRDQLSQMETQCGKLENDNQTLKKNLQEQEKSVQREQESQGITEDNYQLQNDLERTEEELDEVKDENAELKREVMEMKNEMDEMYDTFRENEHDEFRELQKELDMTAKNCRILQFKLRKAERRNEQIEEDRVHYEGKLRMLQDQFDSADAKTHIRILEEELRVAKEVSVRLHDELDIIEDKKLKALEDNKHLTELLEHTDKRQFRMEMEIDKLRDMVGDLKQQLKEERNKSSNNSNCNNNDNNTRNQDVSPDRKLAMPTLVRETSRDNQDYDVSQLMKDLCDTMERENDLKDQLKFTEEEAKMMRRRVSEMDEENENLRLQLKKMSEKASKHKKQEQRMSKELSEERRASEAVKAALTNQKVSSDMVIVVGAEDSDIIAGDEPIPVSQRKDSTDEDLMNVMQLRVQLEMLDQELMTSHKKLDDMDLENENLQDEVKFLQGRLEEKEKSQDSNLKPSGPSSPNAYYEERIKDLTTDVDDLRWKLIEKDRELERLSVVQTRHTREYSHTKKSDRLKKSKSLDNDNDPEMKDMRRQIEHLHMELVLWKKQADDAEERNQDLNTRISELSNRPLLPQIEADGAAIENIELRDQLKMMQADLKDKSDKINQLTDDLQRLSRDTRTFQNIATSPMTPGSPGILNIPPSWPESKGARAKISATNQHEGGMPRDQASQLLALQEENVELRRQMAVLRLQEPRGVADGSPSQSALSSRAAAESSSAKKKIPPVGAWELSSSLTNPKDSSDEEGVREGDQRTPGLSSVVRFESTHEGNENKTTLSDTQPGIAIEEEEFSISVESSCSSSFVLDLDLGQTDSNQSPEVLSAEDDKTAKGLSKSTTKSRDMATVGKDGNSSLKDLPDDGGGGGGGQSSGTDSVKSHRSKSEDEDKYKASVLAKYPDGKSQVVVTGEEGRVELMEKVLDMDDEIGELISSIRRREDEYSRMCRDVKYMKSQMQELKDDNRRNERDLLQELDMLHDKNAVMSNLLDIINERAEAAEEELERRIQDGTTPSPPRSASNVSQVSALSDTSMGSDEVFLNAHGNKEGVITRDWESKLKTRIESLERLLAEERRKVVTAEKKLALSSTETMSPSLSDDVKLRMREKELLQEELVESQRHLHIATDQIQGLRERLVIVEEEYHRLKLDYGKLYDEIDKPADEESDKRGKGLKKIKGKRDEDDHASDSDKTPENSIDIEADHPFLTKKISVIEAPKLAELRTANKISDAEVNDLKAELAKYKSKCEQLEYKVEEINDIWRSKSAASDRDKDFFEAEVQQRIKEVQLSSETLENLRKELCNKDKAIAEYEVNFKEKVQELDRKTKTIKDQENEIKKHGQEQQLLISQISQKDGSIRGLNDTIRVRDERLKEKDEILFKLNSSIDEIKSQLKSSVELNQELTRTMEEKEEVITRLRILTSSPPPQSKNEGSDSDVEKEYAILKESHRKLQETLKNIETEKHKLEDIVEQSRKTMNESMVLWKNEKATLQRDMNVLEEKVRMYEVYNTQGQGEAIESLKEEAHEYFREKETLKLQLESVEVKAEADDRIHKNQVSRLQGDLTDKLRHLKNEVDKNTRLALENERLSVQAEKAYRYQQEERVLKAEYQALKVRYETRFDKMYKEYNKMVATIETLQREKDKDQEIIQAMHKNLSLVKDKYTEELLRAEDDKATLGRQMKEIDELRSHLDGLMKIVRELQDKSTDQERLRADLINKMATDKASWEIERANLNSHINQLEEHLSVSSRQQNRAMDIQVNMGITWEKERKEQKRLLAEAHTLALDLQEQLRSRDEAFAHERKELIRQMEGDRLNWTKEKRETEKRMTQFESNARKLTALQKRLLESQEALEVESQQWGQHRKDLVGQLNQSRQAHAKDCKRIEDVLAGLVQLRELGSILEPPGSSKSELDEAVGQINRAAEDLCGPRIDEKFKVLDQSTEVKQSPRKQLPTKPDNPDSSDIIIVLPSSSLTSEKPVTSTKNQTTHHSAKQKPESKTDAGSRLPAKSIIKPATSNTIAKAIDKLQHPESAKATKSAAEKGLSTGKGASAGLKPLTVSSVNKPRSSSSDRKESNKPKLELETHTWPRKPKSDDQEQLKSAPVVMRPFDFYSRRYQRPPSYTSGTRSAQSSRATTPEVPDLMTNSLEATSGKRHVLPEPPPCFILSHSRSGSVSPHRSSPSPSPVDAVQSGDKPKAKRPVTFGKSLSMDSSDVVYSDSPHRLAGVPRVSNSASTTPTQDYMVSEASAGITFSSPQANSNLLSVKAASGNTRNRKYSPRTARKNFFAETPPTTPESHDILTWPERKSTTTNQQLAQLPAPIELRREAEEEYVMLSSKPEGVDQSKSISTSVSLDEKIHFRAIQDPTFSSSLSSTPETSSLTRTAMSTVASSIPEDAELPSSTTPAIIAPPSTKSAKDKRKFFKKSNSLDSTVGSSIAKVGVSAMPMAAPSGFTPSDFFAAVKGKLKPVFRPKSASSKAKEQEGRSPSPLFIPTEVPDINFGSSGSTLLPVPVPQVNFRELEEEEEEALSEQMSTRSRHFNRDRESQGQKGKWRSKSADRVTPPSRMQKVQNMGSSNEVWKFNETDL